MPLAPGDTFYAAFSTADPTTGAQADADSTPTASVIHNGVTDGAVTVTVTHLATGSYVASGTLPTSYAEGDTVTVNVVATVSGVTANLNADTYILGSSSATHATVDQDYLADDAWTVRNDGTGAAVSGATVTVYLEADYAASGVAAATVTSTTTDASGHWSVTLTPGQYAIRFSFAGEASVVRAVNVR